MYTPIDNKIVSIENLSELIKKIRSDVTNKIVFSNGCFDLLHAGHVRRLEEAKTYGDIHIVGINSDRSVSNLKGFNRPIIDERSRAVCVAALDSVDYVVVFEEANPTNLLSIIKPDWYVISKEHVLNIHINNIKLTNIKLLPRHSDISTTNIINKIQSLDTFNSFGMPFDWYD
jgi:D-beta-D-heptose 7-phosphate kinase / D-beta-D-heptose 1-phosphate adenosyltransferase